MNAHLKAIRFEGRRLMSLYPALAPLLNVLFRSFRHHALPYPSETTELFVDGFQGSGNSLFFVEFQRLQSTPINLVGHGHVPGAILTSVELGVPTVVLVREPVSAIASVMSRWPYISANQGLRAYISFYSRVLPACDGYVIGSFDEVVHDIGVVIRRVNSRFGTSFTSQGRQERARPPIEDPVRQARKADARRVLASAAMERGRARADELFERLCRLAERP